jgi:anti-sigma B factor antagonist
MTASKHSSVLINQSEGITVALIRMASITDGQSIEEIGRTLFDLVDNRDVKKLIVDFRTVSFLSSSMIGVLVQLHKKAQSIEGQVVLCGLRESLMKIFKITRMDRILTFAKDEKEAASKLKA